MRPTVVNDEVVGLHVLVPEPRFVEMNQSHHQIPDQADGILELLDDGALPGLRRMYYLDPAGVQEYASPVLAPFPTIDAGSVTAPSTAMTALADELDPNAIAAHPAVQVPLVSVSVSKSRVSRRGGSSLRSVQRAQVGVIRK